MYFFAGSREEGELVLSVSGIRCEPVSQSFPLCCLSVVYAVAVIVELSCASAGMCRASDHWSSCCSRAIAVAATTSSDVLYSLEMTIFQRNVKLT